MTIDWEEQYYPLELFTTGREASGGDLSAVRAGLALMLSQRKERIEKLKRFVAFHGIDLDGSYDASVQLCEFFTANVEWEQNENRVSNEWAEFCIDTCVFIGELVRSKLPKVKWVILEEEEPEHLYFHEIGIYDGGRVLLPVFSHFILFAHNVLEDDLLDESFRSIFFAEIVEESFRRGGIDQTCH